MNYSTRGRLLCTTGWKFPYEKVKLPSANGEGRTRVLENIIFHNALRTKIMCPTTNCNHLWKELITGEKERKITHMEEGVKKLVRKLSKKT